MGRLTAAFTDPAYCLLSQPSEQGLLLHHRLPLPALGRVLGPGAMGRGNGVSRVGSGGKGVAFFYSLWLVL